MPTKKQIQNMLVTMNVRELREIAKYFGVHVTKQSGGYRDKNSLVNGLMGGSDRAARLAEREIEERRRARESNILYCADCGPKQGFTALNFRSRNCHDGKKFTTCEKYRKWYRSV